jgi:hypothetical protein
LEGYGSRRTSSGAEEGVDFKKRDERRSPVERSGVMGETALGETASEYTNEFIDGTKRIEQSCSGVSPLSRERRGGSEFGALGWCRTR